MNKVLKYFIQVNVGNESQKSGIMSGDIDQFYNYCVNDLQLNVINGWFVRQYANEYNPMHIHTNCSISCVGYLSLPEGIEKEWEQENKDHYYQNQWNIVVYVLHLRSYRLPK